MLKHAFSADNLLGCLPQSGKCYKVRMSRSRKSNLYYAIMHKQWLQRYFYIPFAARLVYKIVSDKYEPAT